MTYINDIFINLNHDYFEFFEWNKNDYIEHIKKIPIIKISNNDLINIMNYEIIIDSNYLSTYCLKCEKYKSNKLFNYLVLTNGNNAMVISFNNDGTVLKKSALIFEDEETICLIAKELKYEKMPYKIIKKEKIANLTRLQKERKKYLLKNIKKISNNRLKYLYYDCFNKEEDNIHIIINTISNELRNNNLDVYNKSDNLFNIIYQQNK